MNRRQRHLRIIENFGKDRERYHLVEVLARHGLTILSDEGIEKLASRIVQSHQRQQRYNRENRTRRIS